MRNIRFLVTSMTYLQTRVLFPSVVIFLAWAQGVALRGWWKPASTWLQDYSVFHTINVNVECMRGWHYSSSTILLHAAGAACIHQVKTSGTLSRRNHWN